jgi:hypothetical protein
MPILKQFKLHVNKDYYEVVVFKTRQEMYEYRKLMNKEQYGRICKFNFDAICSTRIMKPGEHGLFGKILFWEESAQHIGIVSHELSHGALYWWLARINLPFIREVNGKRYTHEVNKKSDELFAELQSMLVNDYWSVYLKENREILTGKMKNAYITAFTSTDRKR